jgi:hypothetical protein
MVAQSSSIHLEMPKSAESIDVNIRPVTAVKETCISSEISAM